MDYYNDIEFKTMLEKFKVLLKENGLKFTKQREVILYALYKKEEHFTPENLFLVLKREYPELNVGIATVYRTLNMLEESHMVTSLSFGVAGKKFEFANKPHHDHMICRQCGLIIEFYNEKIEMLQLEIAKEYEFKIFGHLMQLQGLCKTCALEANTSM